MRLRHRRVICHIISNQADAAPHFPLCGVAAGPFHAVARAFQTNSHGLIPPLDIPVMNEVFGANVAMNGLLRSLMPVVGTMVLDEWTRGYNDSHHL